MASLESPARAGTAEENNAFDVARLVLALLVVYSHAHLLGGFGAERFAELTKNQTGLGTFAVLGFFGISGFLVTRSFVARHDWRAYMRARFLRIMPGLCFALVLTAFGLAPAISFFNEASEGWQWTDAAAYVANNTFVVVRQWSVGGVLTGLPYEGSINGPLWSLFPELCCYGMILFLGVTGALQRSRGNVMACVGLMVIAHGAIVLVPGRENLAPTLIALTGWSSFVTAFLVGAGLYCFREEFGFGLGQTVVWWLVVGVLLKFGGWALLGPVVFPLAIIHGAYSFRGHLPVDLSYGLYLLHFPVLHLLAAAGLNLSGFAVYSVVGMLATAALAAISWCLVEKPALTLKAQAARDEKSAKSGAGLKNTARPD